MRTRSYPHQPDGHYDPQYAPTGGNWWNSWVSRIEYSAPFVFSALTGDVAQNYVGDNEVTPIKEIPFKQMVSRTTLALYFTIDTYGWPLSPEIIHEAASCSSLCAQFSLFGARVDHVQVEVLESRPHAAVRWERWDEVPVDDAQPWQAHDVREVMMDLAHQHMSDQLGRSGRVHVGVVPMSTLISREQDKHRRDRQHMYNEQLASTLKHHTTTGPATSGRKGSAYWDRYTSEVFKNRLKSNPFIRVTKGKTKFEP